LLVFTCTICKYSATIFANGTSENKQSNEINQTREFTDSLGRIVTVDKDIERVAPSGNLAQLIIYTIVPDKMVGWGTRPSSQLDKYFDKDILSLPVFGAFYGAKANLNMEAVISADPQVVIDLGEIKGSKEEMIKQLDNLQDTLGIPVIFVEAYLDNMGQTYRMLGDLLNRQSDGEERAQFSEETISRAKNAEKLITTKTRVYFGVGSDGLTSYPKNSFRTQTLKLAGLDNVVVGKGNNIQVSPEQLIIWNPEVILVDQAGSYEKFIALNSPFSEIDAVKNNRVYVVPEGPFSWIDSPPSVNRILGIDWLGNLFYPEVFNIDIKTEAKAFYNLFYHYDLNDSELDELMINSK
jgi:iron complex transport system substrate-binding protein